MLADARLWGETLPFLGNRNAGGMVQPYFMDVSAGDSIGHMADQVLAQMPGRFALVGMSMGGYVAFEILRRCPGRVSHLMLVNTRAGADDAATRRRRLLLARLAAQQPVFRGFNDAILDQALHPDNRHQPRLLALLDDMAQNLGRDVFRRQQIAVANRPDFTALLSNITIPCHVMWGDGDNMIPAPVQHQMAQGISGAQFSQIAGAGHYVPLEAPAAFASGLLALLAR
ncbi:hypothetical protein TMES_08505 [Thalassospira mesophila]|uniref:AB hydrolase-1 domain-containing protein n=2 Tax=Thalassospira mesophila TaxID=1293891 RepID=A0A1Y2L1E2_9PROT|nr:hypothetical protein TMES_08505 [Thalassospira mesophila]